MRQEYTIKTPLHHTYTYTHLGLIKCSKSPYLQCFTVFLLCLVEVHDAMDNLHRWVTTEERDLIWKLFGGRVSTFGGIDLCFTAAAFLCRLRIPFVLSSIYTKNACKFLKSAMILCHSPATTDFLSLFVCGGV